MQRNVSYVTLYPDEVVDLVNQYFNPYVTNVSKELLDIMIVNKDGTISCTSGNLQDQKHNVQYLQWLDEQKKLEEEQQNPDDPNAPLDPEDPNTGTDQPGEGENPSDPGEVVPPIGTDPGTEQPGGTETPTDPVEPNDPTDPGAGEENWDWIFQ